MTAIIVSQCSLMSVSIFYGKSNVLSSITSHHENMSNSSDKFTALQHANPSKCLEMGSNLCNYPHMVDASASILSHGFR